MVCVAGRGAGKDSIASLIATCAAINFDPRGKLRPGEKATVMCLACDRHQAAILFRYIAGYFETIPALKAMVMAIGGDYIELCNDVAIEVHIRQGYGLPYDDLRAQPGYYWAGQSHESAP